MPRLWRRGLLPVLARTVTTAAERPRGPNPSGVRPAVVGLAVGILLLALLVVPTGGTAPGPRPSVAAVGPRTAAGPPGPADSASRPASSGESTLSVVPNDPADVPNEGVEMNLTGFSSASLGPFAAFQVAAEETIGGYDAVFGLFQNSSFGPIGFFEVFTSVGDQTVHLAYGAPLATVPGMGYCFELTASAGSTWVLTVNGAPFGTSVNASSFDFGATEATVAGGLEFSEVAFYTTSASDVVPSVVLATTMLAVRVGGAWYLPENATARFAGDGSGRWGVEGRDQVPSLAPGEIRTGTSVAPLANGTALWTGGPVPVGLTFTLSSTTTTATLPVVVNATVRDDAGAPLPGVPLSVTDERGGVEVGGGNLTGALGSAKLELLTPNVTAAGTDLVTVASTMLGYSATSSQSLLLTPAIEIVLTASPSAPQVPLNGSITLVFQTTERGAPAPFTTLEFSSALGGSLSIGYGKSASDGSIAVEFYAGGQPATVDVHVIVVEPGAWGGIILAVHIVRPSVSALIQAEPWVAAGLAVLLGATVYMVVRSRRRRPIPDLPLGTVPDAPEGAAGGPDPDLSRTPPSGGNP
jgi:hypothetical protein